MNIHTASCGNNASWLTWDEPNRILYCLDEGMSVENGTVHSYKASTDGELKPVAQQTSISGPVSGAVYGNTKEKHGLAMAHYAGSAVTVWETDAQGSLKHLQDITYTLEKPGPDPLGRQDAPHEHQALLDPTGKYIVVPDLGADLVRVFCFDPETLLLSAHDPLSVKAASGPRHGVFWKSPETHGETYYYLVSEFANTLTGFRVTYPKSGGLKFEQIFEKSTHGDKEAPPGNAAAELHISPDHRFLIVSNRNDSSLQIDNLDPKNSTKEASDSLSNWSLNKDGTAEFKQLVAAGGSFPRTFTLNWDGSMVAVALQQSSHVVLLQRDPKSGDIGTPIANTQLPGQLTSIKWDEPQKGACHL